MDLKIFADTNLFNAGTSFFKQLNIRLNSSSTSSLPLKSILKDKFKPQEIFEKVSAACFLGLVDKSVFDDNLSLFEDKKLSYEQADKKIHVDYEGMMIFAVQIDGIASPTRTQLADLSRAFNRASKSLPVVVLFQYGDFITIATSERTKYKQTWREGEKIGKISLLKDIDTLNPHTGHIKILNDLVLKPDVRDFNGLYQQWREVFDVQLLNRNFYKELSSWYFWALRKVEFPEDAEKNKEIRNSTSVIRLITRLIFVWFLKEKRLVPEILFNKKALDEYLKYDDINSSTYYKAILQNLFFATLNTKMKKDDAKSRIFVNRQYGISLLYRYARFFKNKQKALKLFETIPFLNGGLFENLDKNIGRPDEIRIDCFSNRPVHEKRLKVPDFLFFGSEDQIDLSEVYGSKKRKNETVRGIIHILNSYKFTIAENTPIEEEIALDPELLGKVFENLLASYNPETQTTARKQTGSFYTPREIVNYMVDESLKASLSNLVSKKIDNATEDDIKTGLDILFEYTEKEHAFTDNEVFKIIEAISELKILDPACGSGAFPMGILHKLVFILNKIDEDNKKWRELQKQRAVKETESAYNLGNKEERHQRLKEIEEAFDFNTSDYGRKLFLIENSIYGVDIQPIAVQIAKLRFFISLIVDQKTDGDKENLGILPLPNLETKFVAANTLIGIDKKGQLELNFQNPEIDKKEKELTKVRERHFSARTPRTKEKRRVEDESLRNEIAALLEKDGFASDVTKRLANWNPYDQNASADFFDMEWMFGMQDGFDIVIGNPPYLGFHGIKKSIKNDLKKRFFSANGKFDYYIPFIEQGYYLLKEQGFFIFICQTAFTKRDYGTNIRKFLLKNTSIQQLVDFEHKQMFDNVTNYTGVFSFIKLIPQNNKIKYKFDLTDDYSPVSQNSLDQLPWIFLSDDYSRVVEKIQNQIPLGKIADISEGIVTGLNLLYLKKKNEIKENKFENNYFFTCYRGREIDRYFLHDPSELIFYPYHLVGAKTEPIEEDVLNALCPNYMDYLRQNLPLIQKRKYFVKTNKRWYELWNQRKIANFVSPKILTPELSERNRFMISDSNTFYGDTVCGIIQKEEFRDDFKLKYLLSILNSLVIEWFYKRTTVPKAGGFFIYKVMFLKNIPIPEINISKQNSLIVTADKILTAKKSNNFTDTNALEAKIDGRVAHLYNLTEEEYALVLKETNCPDPFRVAALNVYRDIAREK